MKLWKGHACGVLQHRIAKSGTIRKRGDDLELARKELSKLTQERTIVVDDEQPSVACEIGIR